MSKKENNHSSKNFDHKQKLMVITLLTAVSGLALILVFGAFFFGMAGFFHLFNVQYESLFALVKFVLCFFIVGFFVEPIARLLILITSSKANSVHSLILIRIIFNSFLSWTTIFTADAIVSSIDIPFLTEIFVVLMLYLAEVAFQEKEKIIAG